MGAHLSRQKEPWAKASRQKGAGLSGKLKEGQGSSEAVSSGDSRHEGCREVGRGWLCLQALDIQDPDFTLKSSEEC